MASYITSVELVNYFSEFDSYFPNSTPSYSVRFDTQGSDVTLQYVASSTGTLLGSFTPNDKRIERIVYYPLTYTTDATLTNKFEITLSSSVADSGTPSYLFFDNNLYPISKVADTSNKYRTNSTVLKDNADVVSNATEFFLVNVQFADNLHVLNDSAVENFNNFSRRISNFTDVQTFVKNIQKISSQVENPRGSTDDSSRYLQALHIAHVASLVYFVPAGGVPTPLENINVGSAGNFVLDEYLEKTKYGQLLAYIVRSSGIVGLSVTDPRIGSPYPSGL